MINKFYNIYGGISAGGNRAIRKMKRTDRRIVI